MRTNCSALLAMFLCLCVCSAATQSDPPITDPQIYAQLYINGSVIGEETFISGIQLARDNTTSVSKLDGTALLHLNDTTGCQPNKTLEFPDRSTQNILMVSAGGCTIDQKADTAIALGAAALIVYSTNEQEAIDNSGPSQVRPLFIMFVPADIGEQLRIAGLYVARDRMNRRLRLQISQYDKQVDVWEMTLLAMILLLGLAFILSLALHFRMYWLRRRRMASLNAQRPPGMPTGRAQRHTLSADDLQSQFPVISFTKRLNSTADRKPTETTGDNDSDIETLDVASDDQFVGNELCSICIEDFQEGDPVRRLTCQHVFHKDCIDPWLVKRNAVCPVCKLVLQPQPPESPDSRLSTNIGVDPASNNSTAINIPETPLAMPAQNSLAWHERLRDIIFSRRRTASVIPMTELPSD